MRARFSREGLGWANLRRAHQPLCPGRSSTTGLRTRTDTESAERAGRHLLVGLIAHNLTEGGMRSGGRFRAREWGYRG